MTARVRGSALLGLAADPDAGPSDDITDVPGVTVGHASIRGGTAELPVRTGVTVVLPRGEETGVDAPVAAAIDVVNGFGKLTGVTQVAELGVIETPIALTNTLAVGSAYEGLVQHALARHPDLTTVNPIVAECNDHVLNDIRARSVAVEHVRQAIEAATIEPDLGPVGAGSGMRAFGYAAGLGSASRVLLWPGEHGLLGTSYTLGVLVLANAGRPGEGPSGAGIDVQRDEAGDLGPDDEPAGSCVVVIATDAPLDARQLSRVASRARAGLARAGLAGDHGSGEYTIAFSVAGATTGRVGEPITFLDKAFRAAADLTWRAYLEAVALGEPALRVGGGTVPAWLGDRHT